MWFLNMINLIHMDIDLCGIIPNEMFKVLFYYVNYYLLIIILFKILIEL